jgi:LPXTG-motif cell wall-anchored protein
LAFTGANAIGIGALGGLLLLGGAAMVLAGRRRKVKA